MATVKPNNNQQLRMFKYNGAKPQNNNDPVTREMSNLIAFKRSYLKKYFRQPWFLMFLLVFKSTINHLNETVEGSTCLISKTSLI